MTQTLGALGTRQAIALGAVKFDRRKATECAVAAFAIELFALRADQALAGFIVDEITRPIPPLLAFALCLLLFFRLGP